MDSSDNVCLVCHEMVEFYAVGSCDHPICFKCSTRMRALCDQFYCPICRTDLPEVFFLCTRERFDRMPVRKFILNRKLKIQFENGHIRERFEELLEHRCRYCPDRYPEKTFRALRDHMRKAHTMFYCDLCQELKIFTSERKVYNRQDLATHRRVGDKDDTSYKGHPLCRFCEERFLDKDELYKHLRKDHFFCHFCESLGSQEFYDDYNNLREHFEIDHFLCEEGDCANMQFTNAFRSAIDLQSHHATHHSKAQSKAQARQERTLNIDINLVPRPTNRPGRGGGRDEYDRRGGGGPRHGGRGGAAANKSAKYTAPSPRERQDIDRAIQASLSTMNNEDMKKDKTTKKTESSSDEEFHQMEDTFPSLSSANTTTSTSTVSTSTVTSSASDATGKTSLADRFALAHSRSVQHGVLDDFPTLSSTTPASERPLSSTSAISNSKAPGQSKVYTSAFSAKKKEEDFPELPISKKSNAQVSGSWTNTNKQTKDTGITQKKTVPVKQVSRKPKYAGSTSDNDFPSLGAPANASANGRWFNKSKNNASSPNNSNRPIKESLSSENLNNDSTDIRLRFSPVNVPDSPKSEKTKNKKKKKKDKVTEIKEEKGGQLKGNSSLDDIASLLMTTTVNNADEDGELKHVENNVDRSEKKNKKKEDKVEKKLESKKVETKVEQQSIPAELNVGKESVPMAEYPLHPVKFSIAADDDFPTLGSTSPPKKPPPGFKGDNNSVSKLPPGLGKPQNSSAPPPGFVPQYSSTIDQTDFQIERDVVSIPANLTNYQFTKPDNFQERNQMLIATIQSMCTAQQFSNFKTLSGEFRRSDVNANAYYHRCEEVLGKEDFSQIFPELMALLPEISKQQELLAVYLKTLNEEEKARKMSGKFKDMKGAWTPTQSGFLSCQTCSQVLIRKDYNIHGKCHSLDSDFPSLSSNSTEQKYGQGKSGWVRAK